MAENKTQPTDTDPMAIIDAVENKTRKRDAQALMDMLRDITGHEPVVWGKDLIGFDQYAYKYDSGREGEMLKIGFSPRKTAMSIYAMMGAKRRPDLLEKLGPHKTGAACLYVTNFDKIDVDVLREILAADYEETTAKYDCL